MRINDSIFLGAIVPELDNGTLVIQQNKRILFLSLLSRLIDVVVRGVSPLSLLDAIAGSLEYLKAFGGTEQRNLPDGYIQRQFIYMMDGSYLLTDIVPTYDGHYELEIQTTNIANSPATYLGCLQSGSTDQGLRFAHITNGAVRVAGFGSHTDSASGTTAANTRYKFVWNNNVAAVTTGSTTIFSNVFSDNQSTTVPLAINALNTGGVISGNIEGIYLYSFKAWDNQGNLIADYVPAVQKGTVPVVGFYDTVSGTFKTATAGTFAAGGEAVPTPDTPMDIWCNNGVLKLNKNLCNNVFEQGSINTNGSDYGGSELTSRIRLKDFITLPAGTYTISCDSAYEVYLYRTGGTAAWLQTDTFTFSSSGQVRFAVRNKANPTADVLPTAPVNVMLNAGSSALPYTPYSATGIYADGTVETINVHGKNLFDKDGVTIENGKAIGADGSISNVSSVNLCASYIPVSPNTTYTFSGDVLGTSNTFFRVAQYKADQTFISRSEDSTSARSSYTFTTGADTHYIRFHYIATANISTYQLEQGSTATTYEPYYNGGTATAEMLLKVGNYEDVQEILSGAITRNIGVKVLDGTEDWQLGADTSRFTLADGFNNLAQLTNAYVGYSNCYIIIATSVSIQSRLANNQCGWNTTQVFCLRDDRFTTVAGFQQFLADQYAAGTPVIVVYPLATPTTESVAGQTMQVQQGDNIVEITQASMDGLEIEAKYQAAVTLTIQEVQDANLDPNVEVTIN